MSPVTLLLIGLAIGWVGLTDQYQNLVDSAKSPGGGGYSDIELGRFIAGGLVAGLPLLLKVDDETKQQYVGLMLLAFLVVNYRGAQTFANEMRSFF